jgi:hypothetical protein
MENAAEAIRLEHEMNRRGDEKMIRSEEELSPLRPVIDVQKTNPN